MAEENFPKILAFLANALARTDHQMCVKLELIYCPASGFRAETIRAWQRSHDPEQYFGVPVADNEAGEVHSHVFTEKFAGEIIELAEAHAESFGQGRHRFQIRSTQHLQSRELCAFVVLPSFTGTDGEALTVGGAGTPALEPTQAGIVQQLMRHLENSNRQNKEMVQTLLQGVGAMGAQLREENSALREQLNSHIEERRLYIAQIEEAKSGEHARQIEAAVVTGKQERTDYAVKKIVNLFPVLLAKWASGGKKKIGARGKTSPLADLVGKFIDSLDEQQQDAIESVLDIEQKIALNSAIDIATDGGDPVLLPTIVDDFATTLRAPQIQAIMGALKKEQATMLVNVMQLAKASAGARESNGVNKPEPEQEAEVS